MIIVQIAGRLGADVETRVTAEGEKVHTLRLATNIRRNGRDETVWWRVSLWGDRWNKMLPYLTKGSALIVVGEMTRAPELFQNRDGQQQVSSLEVRADIVKFSPFGRGNDQGNENQGVGQQQQAGYRAPMGNSVAAQQPHHPQQPYGAPVESTVGTAPLSLGGIPDEDLPF